MRKLFILLAIGMVAMQCSCGKGRTVFSKGDADTDIQQCIKYSEQKKFEEAIECLEVFKSRFPNSELGQTAELRIGDAYFRKKEYLLAADSYQTFTKLHPTHPQADYAYYRVGLSYLKETPKGVDRDQQYIGDAIKYLQIAAGGFPNSPFAPMIQKDLNDARTKVAKRHFYIGNFYYRTGEYIAAIPRFLEVVNNYPDSGMVPISLYKIIISCIRLNQIDNARESFNVLNQNFPNNPLTKKAEAKLLSASHGG